MAPRAGDTPILLADSKLARKILNWRSTKNLSDMCKDGWKFAQQCSKGVLNFELKSFAKFYIKVHNS